jgi:predicted transcriptional regulator
MTGENIGVLGVLGVQRSKLIALTSLAVGILEANNLAEDSDLLDKVLQSPSVNREAGLAFGSFQAGAFLLLQLLSPDGNNLLKLWASKETERSISSQSTLVGSVWQWLLETITQSLAQVRELGLVGESAQSCHDFLPVWQIGIVDNVPQILANNWGK